MLHPMITLYESDVYAWSQHQAALLREGALTELDLVNLAEEIESVGISQKHAVRSHLKILVLHLLKWQAQPAGRATGHSWRSSIRNARGEIAVLLEYSPSLRRQVPQLLAAAYPRAREDASEETSLPLATFPVDCPWDEQQVLHDDFWPEAGSAV